MKAVSIISKGSYHIGGKKVTIEGSDPVETRFWPGGPPVTYDPNRQDRCMCSTPDWKIRSYRIRYV